MRKDKMSDLELYHYGTAHVGMTPHSGRYPWGSGENPKGGDFLSEYRYLKSQGKSDNDIAAHFNMSSTEFRQRRSIEREAERAANIARANRLKDHGNSYTEIGRLMGVNESLVRSWLKDAEIEKAITTNSVANTLKENVNKKGFIDVGSGVEADLGVSSTKLNTALKSLKDEGYEVYKIPIPQATNPNQFTTVKVLAPPDTTWADVMKNTKDIHTITEYSPDGGKSWNSVERPSSLDSSRVKIRYAEEGGVDKDGVIELRRGVNDISLGNSSYAQVRIMVDGSHYLKGMAMYSDDLPDGVDVLFNTNKSVGTPMMGSKDNTVLKPIKSDPDNPFGALIKAGGQRYYTDADGNEKLSPINKLKEEGDWDHYSRNLSSQMLSKQSVSLINRQLNLSYADKAAEFDDICKLTNPAVKKKLLQSFADDCDAAAVELKAAALPRQASKVILPLTCMKDNEIYAPTYKNGERVVLIRYPHGGTFEIPELTVNNTNKKAKGIMGNAIDAVGISSKVAERLSGADFDGDTVVVIPLSDKVKITTSSPLKGLEGFDPKRDYKGYEGMKRMTKKQTQTEMGKVSNLITDMTLKGATPDELARAVRHSMVVIDAEKHGLNFRQSEIDNGIDALKRKYQSKPNGTYGGASTLISKASGEVRVNERKIFSYSKANDTLGGIDPETGKKIYKETGRTYEKNGKTKKYLTTSTKMAETDDAMTLSSGTAKEKAYANYANKMKALGNAARKEFLATGTSDKSSSAAKTYASEVASLNAKLNLAIKNAPKERQAQIYAYNTLNAKKKDNPNMSSEDKSKEGQRSLSAGRVKYGADKSKVRITITDREWEAIQAGAISSTKQSQIFNHTDLEVLRELATPRASRNTISSATKAKMQMMSNAGFTIAEIAEACGASTSTVSAVIKE